MEFKNVLYDKEDGIGIVTLNRPKVMNALNDELLIDIAAVMDIIAEDDEVKAVIITGGNKVFAAGADLAFMSKASPIEAEDFMELAARAIGKISNLGKPVVAALTGMALGGGCELCLSCDLRIAAQGTKIGLPEITLGTYPGGGGTQRLGRIVGTGWAKHMLMTGDIIDADAALKIGLVTKVVPTDQLMDEAKKMASKLASRSTIAMRLLKRCVNQAENTNLESGLLFERNTWSFLTATEDGQEGMKAFLEKRKPVYKGK